MSDNEKLNEFSSHAAEGGAPEGGADTDIIIKKRSPFRCHLISRIPFYCPDGNASMYELKFTKGNVFMIDALEEDHVYHVLTGFFIRRHIDCFVGKASVAAIRMPVCDQLLECAKFFQTSRLCVIIPKDQDPSRNVKHIISAMHRAHTRFAIDLDTILTTDFTEVLNAIDYILVDASNNLREQIMLATPIKAEAKWIKFVAINVNTQEMAETCFKLGFDHVLCKYFQSEILTQEEPIPIKDKQLQIDILQLLNEIFKEEPNFELLGSIIGKYSFMVATILNIINITNPRLASAISTMTHAVTYLGKEQMKNFVCVCCIHSISSHFYNVEVSRQKSSYELLKYALVRGRFLETIATLFGNRYEKKVAFQTGIFSIIGVIYQSDLEANDSKSGISEFENEIRKCLTVSLSRSESLLSKGIQCISALEDQNLSDVISVVQTLGCSVNTVLRAYEDAIMWSDDMVAAF